MEQLCHAAQRIAVRFISASLPCADGRLPYTQLFSQLSLVHAVIASELCNTVLYHGSTTFRADDNTANAKKQENITKNAKRKAHSTHRSARPGKAGAAAQGGNGFDGCRTAAAVRSPT